MKNNEIIDKHEYYSNLFDFYEALFTEKQIEYFKDYYFYDLSLSEIASNHQISRSAVFDVIKKMHDSLNEYEDKLGLFSEHTRINKLLSKYEEEATKENNKLTMNLIKEINNQA